MDLTCSFEGAGLEKERRAVRPLAWWVAPDLAMVVACIALLWCVFVFDGLHQLFRDGDTGWHIRTGERILAGGGFPTADPYSLLKRGEPWFAWEWGSDVIMAAAHQLGGPAYVAGLFGLAIAGSFWLYFRLSWAANGHFLIAGALAAPLLMTEQIHWHARPHLFSWLLIAGTVLYAERKRRNLLAIAAASVVWANLHASFFLAPVIMLIYAAHHFLRPRIWEVERVPGEARWFLQAAAISSLATLVNPYGWSLHRHVFSYLRDTELLSRVSEFATFDFFHEGAAQILAMLFVAAFGGVLAFSQGKLAHALLIGLFVGVGLQSARGLPVAALIALPLANGAITEALGNACGLRAGLRKWLDDFLMYGRNLRSFDSRFGGPLLACLGVGLLVVGLPSAQAGFSPSTYPVAAASWIPPDARLLAPDLFGGYLIYRFNGRPPVFFDGRSDFYGAEYMKNYLALIELREGWRGQVSRHRFTHALLPNRYSLVPALEALGWKRSYRDGVATVLVAPPPQEKD